MFMEENTGPKLQPNGNWFFIVPIIVDLAKYAIDKITDAVRRRKEKKAQRNK